MSGVLAPDGSMNITVVDGSSLTGLYAADGSINVVVSDGSAYVGAYHPCGAWNVTVSDGSSFLPIRAPDGSLYITEADVLSSGQRVTVVSGSLTTRPDAPVLTWTSDDTVDPPTFDIVIDNTVSAGDTFELEYADNNLFTGSTVYTTTVSASDIGFLEITLGDDEAPLSAFGAGTWYVRCRVGPAGNLSDYSNTVTGTIASSYEAESEAIFAAFTTPPDDIRKGHINDLVVALKADLGGGVNVWNSLDVLHVYAAADSQASLINWKNPGTYDGTVINAPTFTADVGYTGNGTTMGIDTNFNPTTAVSPKFLQTTNHLGAWTNGSNTAQTQTPIGVVGATNTWCIFPRVTGDFVRFVDGVNFTQIQNTNADSRGHFVVSRTASNLTTGYINAVSQGTDATAGAALENLNMFTLARNAAGSPSLPWGKGIAAAHIGEGLTGAQVTALYNGLNTYISSI